MLVHRSLTMFFLFVSLLCIVLAIASDEKFGIDNVEIQLGQQAGISQTSTISQENLQKILTGVENGNRNNIYFYGLLKLYGISLSKDLALAAQNFDRASGLGHKEATTAYGVMLMSGHGIRKDLAGAMKYFRKGVELGDMVRELLYVVQHCILTATLSSACLLSHRMHTGSLESKLLISYILP